MLLSYKGNIYGWIVSTCTCFCHFIHLKVTAFVTLHICVANLQNHWCSEWDQGQGSLPGGSASISGAAIWLHCYPILYHDNHTAKLVPGNETDGVHISVLCQTRFPWTTTHKGLHMLHFFSPISQANGLVTQLITIPGTRCYMQCHYSTLIFFSSAVGYMYSSSSSVFHNWV